MTSRAEGVERSRVLKAHAVLEARRLPEVWFLLLAVTASTVLAVASWWIAPPAWRVRIVLPRILIPYAFVAAIWIFHSDPRSGLWLEGLMFGVAGLSVLVVGRLPADLSPPRYYLDQSWRRHPQGRRMAVRGYAAGVVLVVGIVAGIVVTSVYIRF